MRAGDGGRRPMPKSEETVEHSLPLIFKRQRIHMPKKKT